MIETFFEEDRCASFALEVVVVENKLACFLIVAEEVSGHQHLVDESCLAIVGVGNDGVLRDILHTIKTSKFPFSGHKITEKSE